VYEELAGLLGPLSEALAPLATQIRAAFVYGSVAIGAESAESDIDLMVLAEELEYQVLFEAQQPAEQALARRVNPTLMSPEE
jgi:predicted nucleotidyltransferase